MSLVVAVKDEKCGHTLQVFRSWLALRNLCSNTMLSCLLDSPSNFDGVWPLATVAAGAIFIIVVTV